MRIIHWIMKGTLTTSDKTYISYTTILPFLPNDALIHQCRYFLLTPPTRHSLLLGTYISLYSLSFNFVGNELYASGEADDSFSLEHIKQEWNETEKMDKTHKKTLHLMLSMNAVTQHSSSFRLKNDFVPFIHSPFIYFVLFPFICFYKIRI